MIGAPKTFQEMIRLALCGGPLEDTPERAYQVFKDYVDYHFQKARAKHPECEAHLQELFEDMTERQFKERPMTIEEWKAKK